MHQATTLQQMTGNCLADKSAAQLTQDELNGLQESGGFKESLSKPGTRGLALNHMRLELQLAIILVLD